MSEWPIKLVGDLATFHRGITWASSQETEKPEPGCVPVLRIPNVQERLDTNSILFLRGISQDKRTRFAATRDWLLLVGSNGNPDRVGDCVRITQDSDFLFASFLVGVKPNTQAGVDPCFLHYLFRSDSVRKAISDSIKGTTGLRNISLSHLAAHELRCPLPPEQRKLARILTTLDKLIEKTEALIAKYHAIKQGLMHDLFTRGVDAHGHLRPTQAEAPGLYKQSELGWIPKEWSLKSASDICHEITKGATPPQMYDEPGLCNVPFIRVQNLSFDGTLLFDDQQLFIPAIVHNTSLVRSKVFPGDVLMNLVGPPMGKVSIVPPTFLEWNINRAIAIFRTLDICVNVFLSHFLLSEIAFKWLFRRAKRTSCQTNITLQMCRQLPVPISDDKSERIRITDLLNNADTRLVSEKAVLNKLHRLKTGLMQDLLTGKVRVKVDEAEEVAP